MPSYTITEPHPTVAQNTYIHAGRGGAGNHFRAPLTTPPAGVPSTITPVVSAASTGSASSARRFHSGRGGAGNAHDHVERPVISFEDEFSRADSRERNEQLGSGYHVGRGGAGNFRSAATKKKARTGSASSTSSGESSASGGSVLARLSSALGRR